jgi:FkbM family methyltransferase
MNLQNLEQFNYKNFNVLVRPNTSDSFVVKEVLSGEYRKLCLQKQDIVLDLGSNIGMFALYANDKVKQIICFEPESDNYNLSLENLKLNNINNVIVNNAAVVGNDDKQRHFSINTKKNKGAHSLVSKRGRDTTVVQCENINTIIDTYNPTCIKMDVEGGEYEILPAIKDWTNINQIILEFHHAHLNDTTKEKFHKILELLSNIFTNVDFRKDPKGAWVSIIYCRK